MLQCMIRIAAFLILLIAIDTVVCPVLCLNLDTASHQTSTVPSQGVGCAGGFCSPGQLPVRAHQPEALIPVQRLTERPTFRPVLDPTADIDHPPRIS